MTAPNAISPKLQAALTKVKEAKLPHIAFVTNSLEDAENFLKRGKFNDKKGHYRFVVEIKERDEMPFVADGKFNYWYEYAILVDLNGKPLK